MQNGVDTLICGGIGLSLIHIYHHIQEITEAWARRLDAANVIGLSEANHRRIHKEYDRSYKAKKKMLSLIHI